MIRHHTSYQGLRCIFPAFPALLPHRDQSAALHTKTDTKSKKSENLRAVGRGHIEDKGLPPPGYADFQNAKIPRSARGAPRPEAACRAACAYGSARR